MKQVVIGIIGFKASLAAKLEELFSSAGYECCMQEDIDLLKVELDQPMCCLLYEKPDPREFKRILQYMFFYLEACSPIVMSSEPSADGAVQSFKSGAYDYIPVSTGKESLLAKVGVARARSRVIVQSGEIFWNRSNNLIENLVPEFVGAVLEFSKLKTGSLIPGLEILSPDIKSTCWWSQCELNRENFWRCFTELGKIFKLQRIYDIVLDWTNIMESLAASCALRYELDVQETVFVSEILKKGGQWKASEDTLRQLLGKMPEDTFDQVLLKAKFCEEHLSDDCRTLFFLEKALLQAHPRNGDLGKLINAVPHDFDELEGWHLRNGFMKIWGDILDSIINKA